MPKQLSALISPTPSDIDIAQSIDPVHIKHIAEYIGLNEDDYELYGRYKAKVCEPYSPILVTQVVLCWHEPFLWDSTYIPNVNMSVYIPVIPFPRSLAPFPTGGHQGCGAIREPTRREVHLCCGYHPNSAG